jgi:hypothetical protein
MGAAVTAIRMITTAMTDMTGWSIATTNTNTKFTTATTTTKMKTKTTFTAAEGVRTRSPFR